MEESVQAADGFFREFSFMDQRPRMDDNEDGKLSESSIRSIQYKSPVNGCDW